MTHETQTTFTADDVLTVTVDSAADGLRRPDSVVVPTTPDVPQSTVTCGYFTGRKIPPNCRRWMSIEQAISTAKSVRAQAPDPTDLHKGIRMACDSIIDGFEALLRKEAGNE